MLPFPDFRKGNVYGKTAKRLRKAADIIPWFRQPVNCLRPHLRLWISRARFAQYWAKTPQGYSAADGGHTMLVGGL
jgi:p-aminobenzoyl-glutamate transporter AbgT